jgi:WD40 repeat protein
MAQLAQRLADRLEGTGILLVAGESGAGKSSLLRAGLMPWLAAGAMAPGSQRWPRRVIRPTGSPLRELAMQLADMAGADPVSVYRSLSVAPDVAPMLVEQAVRIATGRGPARGPGGPADTAAWAPPRLVLVVDQFEELFTAREDSDVGRVEQEAFIAALDAATTVRVGQQKLPAALVVAAVRVDFLGRLIAYPPLKAALEAGPFMVGPMSEAELRLAITGPAAEAGLAVEPALVDAVIAELREGGGGGLGSGVLPLMSQAMAATWQRREGSKLTLRGYRRAGGVADAVNRSAQTAYDTLTSPQKDAARLVFTQLTVTTPDGQLARRRCSRADLRAPGSPMAANIDTVIEVFSAQRLLVLGKDSVEISHDALLQAWKQLRDWLGDDQLDRALYSQVITDADTWDSNGRDPSYLYQPGRLAAIDAATTRWQRAPSRYPPLPATTQAFLDAAHHAARRRIRRRRSGFAILAALTALAVAASGFAFSQRAAADRQRDQAIYNQVVAEALEFGTGDTTLAAQLTLAAYRLQPTQDLASRLLNTENTPLSAPLAAGGGFVYSVAFSRAGHMMASGSFDGTIRLWNVTDPAHPRPLGQPLPSSLGIGGPAGAQSVAFSPDGRTLTSGNIQLWDIADPTRPHLLGQAMIPVVGGFGNPPIQSVAFSADGRTLAVGDSGNIQLWNVADPAHLQQLGQGLADAAGAPVQSVAFSAGGYVLASGDADGTVRLWDVADPAHPRQLGQPLTGGGAPVNAVAFSPDGHTLASGDNAGTVRLWDVADPVHSRQLGPILTGGGAVASVAFSPDGHTLAGGSLDGTIWLWDVVDPSYPSPLGQRLTGDVGAVDSVAFSPDGHTLASGGLNGIRLWSLPQTILPGSAGLNSVAFSPDGHILASSDYGGTVRLWNAADPARPFLLPGPSLTGGTAAIYPVVFGPDGHLLATGTPDGAVQLWDAADPAHLQQLGQRLAGATGAPVQWMAFSPDGRTLATGTPDGVVQLWDAADPVQPRPIGPILTGNSVAFSLHRHLLAIGEGGAIQLWDVTDPAHPRQLGQFLSGSTVPVDSVAFSSDGNTLASGDDGGTIQLSDVTDPAHPRQLGQPLVGGGAQVNSVAFSPDGHTLASGSGDGTTRLWDVADPADPRPLGQFLSGSTVPWTRWRSAPTGTRWPAAATTAPPGCGT